MLYCDALYHTVKQLVAGEEGFCAPRAEVCPESHEIRIWRVIFLIWRVQIRIWRVILFLNELVVL